MPHDVAEAVSQHQLAESLIFEPTEADAAADHTGAGQEAEVEPEYRQPNRKSNRERPNWLATEQERCFPTKC